MLWLIVIVLVVAGYLVIRHIAEVRKQEELRNRAEEQRRRTEQQERDRLEMARKDRIAADFIVTSTSRSLPGYRIINQKNAVAESDPGNVDQALFKLRLKAARMEATGVVNIRIHRSRGGVVNVMGDAVVAE